MSPLAMTAEAEPLVQTSLITRKCTVFFATVAKKTSTTLYRTSDLGLYLGGALHCVRLNTYVCIVEPKQSGFP